MSGLVLMRLVPMVSIDGNSIGNWLSDNVVFVMFVAVAIVVLVAALTKKLRDAMLSAVIVLIALVILYAGANWRAISDWAGSIIFQK